MPRDEEILKRRARFVSAALLVVAGCTHPKEGAVAVPDSEATKPTPEPPVKPPPRVEPPANRPTLDAKVTAAADAERVGTVKQIETVYKLVDKLAGAVPAACVLSEPSCHARFKAFADQIAQAREDIRDLTPAHCPAKLPDDKALEALRSAHGAWLGEWLRSIEKIAGETADAGTAWEDLRVEAAKAHPHPCLKFSCP